MIPSSLSGRVSQKVTLLSIAAGLGAEHCFRLLLSRGGTHEPDDLAEYAAAGGSLAILKELGALGLSFKDQDGEGEEDEEDEDDDRQSIARAAARMGHLDLIRWLWTKGVNFLSFEFDFDSPLYTAALFGYLEIVTFLVEEVGMPVAPAHTRKRDGRSLTATLPPASPGQGSPTRPPPVAQVSRGKFERDRRKTGLPKGITPLHSACLGRHAEIVSYLLMKDRRVCFVDRQGLTALD
jgi:ankyrin repeat protein